MTFGEMKTALREDLSVSATDVFFTNDFIENTINRGIAWACGLFDWPHTEQAVIRDSVANQEYYNRPENFKKDSVFLIVYNGDRYEKTAWRAYQNYQLENGVNATDKICSDFRDQLFINPAPSSDVVGGIEIWGHENPDALASDSEETVFEGDPEIEEAILLWCEGRCLKKQRGSYYDRGVQLQREAKVNLEEAWKKIAKKQADYTDKDINMFNPPNYVQSRGSRRIGRFTRYDRY